MITTALEPQKPPTATAGATGTRLAREAFSKQQRLPKPRRDGVYTRKKSPYYWMSYVDAYGKTHQESTRTASYDDAVRLRSGKVAEASRLRRTRSALDSTRPTGTAAAPLPVVDLYGGAARFTLTPDEVPNLQAPGVYIAWGKRQERPLYIGKAVSLAERALSPAHHRIPYLPNLDRLEFIITTGKDEASTFEGILIRTLAPTENRKPVPQQEAVAA